MNLCSRKDIRELLSRHDFKLSKRLGQNFLIASWVPERIAENCGISDGDTAVFEIGPGIGCLTAELAKRASKVAALEIDQALFPLLSETLSEFGNVDIVKGDVLKSDIRQIAGALLGERKTVACANLPYYITTPALSRLIDAGIFSQITVMVQKEVAERICAQAGSPEYGAFSVYAGLHYKPHRLFDVPAGCFMPQPKVDSSVVALIKREQPPADIRDEEMFAGVVRAAFSQRRKTIQNALFAAFSSVLSKDELKSVLTDCGVDAGIRGEKLGIRQFAEISNRIADKKRVGDA